MFAFFFLRLYKSTLGEIKFYQNELTDLAAIQIALETANLSKDPSNITLVIGTLAKTRELSGTLSKADTDASDSENLKDIGEFLERFGKVFANISNK